MNRECNLVLAGGGVKGIALVGAVEVLHERGYRFRRIAGTSAGAIVGGLIAAGYRGKELYEIVDNAEYQRFRDPGFFGRLWLPGKLAALYFKKGLYRGDYFCRWYEDLLAQKGVHTFGDLQFGEKFEDGLPYPFVAVAANISRGQLFFLPRDLRSHRIDPVRQSVAGAVRASIAMPGFYQPVRSGHEYLVDGGILLNYPFDCFANDALPTVGIKLSAQPGASQRPHNIHGPFSYGSAVLRTMLNAQDQVHLDNPETVRNTIFVDTSEVTTTEFDLGLQQQRHLYKAGQHAAEKFLMDTAGVH